MSFIPDISHELVDTLERFYANTGCKIAAIELPRSTWDRLVYDVSWYDPNIEPTRRELAARRRLEKLDPNLPLSVQLSFGCVVVRRRATSV